MLIALVKFIHVATVVISGAGFFLRGVYMIRHSPLRTYPLMKIAPHVNDTLLLISAMFLAHLLGISPLTHSWLVAKVIALFVYIALAMVAFRFASTPSVAIVAGIAALFTVSDIVQTAIRQNIRLVLFW